MKKIVLTNDEKVLLKTLCSVSGGGTDLMIFLKDNFFDDKFIAVDDKNKEVIFFYNILSNCNKEIKKLSHLIKVIQFLDENDFILLNPYNRAPSNIPSIIWIKATRPYSLTSNNDIQIANNIIMSKGIVTENGVRIMDGRRLEKVIIRIFSLGMRMSPSISHLKIILITTLKRLKKLKHVTNGLEAS